MKKSLLLLAMLLISAGCANAAEPLLLQPLGTVLSTSPTNTPVLYNDDAATQVNVEVGNVPNVNVNANGVYEATYTPNLGENMVPQNAAAKGEPIPGKRHKLINIRTKQRSQGNDYWNPGGKGNKTFFE